MNTCDLEVETFGTTCDGCGRKIKKGEPFITNIDSCCGGCCRSLCAECIASAYYMIDNYKEKS